MSLCQYKDILGKPNIGFHESRIFNFALNDILGTVFLAFILKWFYNDTISIIHAFVLMFLFGQFCHLIFCVDTTFMSLLKL